LAAACLASCTTVENRRDLNCGYGHVCGPYTCGKYLQKKEVTVVASDFKGVTK
jgi:hypothetical protein